MLATGQIKSAAWLPPTDHLPVGPPYGQSRFKSTLYSPITFWSMPFPS
jgi:hypothetical protein